jgi:hypothetical protein
MPLAARSAEGRTGVPARMFSQKIVNWIAVCLMSACLLLASEASAQTPASAPKQQAGGQQTILFGAAYYDEYAPNDRLQEDVRMMKATGITVVRIAEPRGERWNRNPESSISATSITCLQRWTKRESRSSWAHRHTDSDLAGAGASGRAGDYAAWTRRMRPVLPASRWDGGLRLRMVPR